MKKLSLACLFLAAATFGASAQLSVVKDAKKNFKDGDDINIFVAAIQPALTNPQSANLAETWYTAGEVALGNFDKIYNQYILTQKIDAPQAKNMGESLLTAYSYFLKALPLDSLPDEKGKVKPKYSSKIQKAIGGNSAKYNDAASLAFDVAKDYPLASKLWDVYLNMPYMDVLGKEKPKALDANGEAQLLFFNGYAKYQAENMEGAYADFIKALNSGFEDDNKQIYVFATNLAGMLKKTDDQLRYAKMGYDRTGETQYMNIVINNMLENDKYDDANAMIDDMLTKATEPAAQAPLYLFKGLIVERTEKDPMTRIDKATGLYKKCIELKPDMAAGYYNLAAQIVNKANELENNASDAEFANVQKQTVPMKIEAANYFKKAYELDEVNFSNVPSQLENLKYGMNNAEGEAQIKAIIESL